MADAFRRSVNFEELGALVGGLLGAVDHLMYMAFRPVMEREAARAGGDPDSPAALRKLAEVSVQVVNSHLAGGPAQAFAEATSDDRVERLARTPPTPAGGEPGPTLKIVP